MVHVTGTMIHAAGDVDGVPSRTRPLPIVSIDTHIGPRLGEDLRAYCPSRLLDEFDAFVAATEEENRNAPPGGAFGRGRAAFIAQHEKHLATDGHHDMDARLADMDRDGVSGEVIFHGSMNGQPIPFSDSTFFTGSFLGDGYPERARLEIVATGIHMFNQWLADVVSIQPERHAGCAQLPTWDIDATLAEIQWARQAGLRSVNWPTSRPGILEFDDPKWEPVWELCAELQMPLTTHCGAVVPGIFTRDPSEVPYAYAIVQMESGGWPSRRALHRMLFSGVFDRYPDLKFVLTEQAGGWWSSSMREMDSAYVDSYTALKDVISRPPSEYCKEQVFIGASFISAAEATEAVAEGYACNVMWGSDYPHPEGTWAIDEPERTRLHLRNSFSAVPGDDAVTMLSTTAARVYGLDLDRLQTVADRISAPTLDEIARPLEALPGSYSKAFRKLGPWA